ncbi:tetratricopeptide repeat protein [Winogradskyella ursingii]|uniref:tetratricopeptide repeat protein n=1 Tax=Winogradskyella ursingii TaxID=2686079 RepID=UPI0015CAB3D8|nr:tetratricopeptide repeat protein [Winogradskyella ursingii]
MKFNHLLIALFFVCVATAQNSDDAKQLFATGNYTKAIEAFSSLEDKDEFYDKIAKSYVALGNYDQALNNYKMAIAANGNDDLLKYEYAKLLSRTKNYDEASELFKNIIKKDSLNPNYHYELGLVLEKQRDSTATEKFMSAFGLDYTHQKAIFKLAKHHLIKREFEVTHGFADKGLESYPNNVELISLKAQAYYYQEYYTHAIEWFKKLLDMGEESEFIHEKLSLSYAQNSDYHDAIKHRKLALKYNPLDARAMYVIGTYYERLKDFENAETYISSSLKLQDVPLSNEYRRLGTILNRQKKYEEAIKAFQIALKEDPTDMMTEFYLVRTKDEFYKDLDTKIKLYKNYIEKHKKSPFVRFAEQRLKELNQEKFLQED